MRQLARQLSPERSQNGPTSMHVGLLFKMMMIFHALLLRSSCEAVENDDNIIIITCAQYAWRLVIPNDDDDNTIAL